MTIQQFRSNGISQLQETSPSPQLDIDVLLEYCLKLSKTQLLLKRQELLSPQQQEWLEEAVQKRKTGLPIAYITGHKEFYGYDFIVSPKVLIPKPDTEILVERAIETIIEKMDARPNALLTICDMCTGSGCIGLAVLRTLIDEYKIPASKLPEFTLVDISFDALEIARKNAKELLKDFPEEAQLEKQVRFVQSNLFEQIPYTFDIILTNPPYIPHTMVEDLLKDGRSEPRLALDGDISIFGDRAYDINGDELDDGLEIIRNLIPQAKTHLSPLGKVLMETGEYNAREAAFIAEAAGFKSKIIPDLEGQLRVVELDKTRG